jgi:hypothetical protein
VRTNQSSGGLSESFESSGGLYNQLKVIYICPHKRKNKIQTNDLHFIMCNPN